jgi:hypothetical protein
LTNCRVDIQRIAVAGPAGNAVKSEPLEGPNERRNNAVLFLLQRGMRDGAREGERLLKLS